MLEKDENFVIFLTDCKLPTYRKPEFVKGKKANDIKSNMNLKKDFTLAIRTPTFIQYADPFVVLTDDYPQLINNQRFNFSYAIQRISIDDINSIEFIFKCEVDNILPNSTETIKMPSFLVHFYYDEFYKKTGKDVLNRIVTIFKLPIENPQLFINGEIVDFDNLTAIEILKRLRCDKNQNVFKCHLTDQALEQMEKRVVAIQELILNETVYLERLNYLFNHFTILIKKANVFSEKAEKYKDFKDCLRRIFKYHTSFYLELKNMKIEYETPISRAFLNLGDCFSINQDLVRQYAKLRLLMSEVKSNGDIKYIKTGVFSHNKVDIDDFINIPFHQPLIYTQILQRIIEATPKSHYDYSFLRMSESKIKSMISHIDSELDKMINSFELISLINRIDQTSANTVSITGQSLKSYFDVVIRGKDCTIKRPGVLYLFKNKILCTFRNGFGKNIKEAVNFYNKIKKQAFVISSDQKPDSILFFGDSQNSFNVTFESKDRRDEFLKTFSEVRQNLIVTKPHQIFSEEILPSSFNKVPAPPMYNLSAAALSSTVLFFTGGSTEGKKDHCSPLVTFDVKGSEFSVDSDLLTPVPDMRMTFSSSQNTGRLPVSLYLFGGRKSAHVMIYDQKQWVELPRKAPFSRIKHTLVSFEGNLIVFGGLDDQNQAKNDLFMYSLTKHEWSKIKAKNPPCRYDHSAVVYKNVMIVHGGRKNEDEKLADTWMFNFSKMEWTQMKLRKNSAIVPRSGHAAVIVNQFMIVVGGEGYCALPFALNIDTFKVIRMTVVGNYVCGMNCFAAAVMNDHENQKKQIICFGGFNNDGSVILNSFTRLCLPDEITSPDQLPSENEIIC